MARRRCQRELPLSFGPVPVGKKAFVEMRKLVAATLDCLAENGFRGAVRVAVRGVEEVDAGFEADVDELLRTGHIRIAPRAKKFVCAAKSGSAKAELRDFEAGASKKTVFHGWLDAPRAAELQLLQMRSLLEVKRNRIRRTRGSRLSPDAVYAIVVEDLIDADERRPRVRVTARREAVQMGSRW